MHDDESDILELATLARQISARMIVDYAHQPAAIIASNTLSAVARIQQHAAAKDRKELRSLIRGGVVDMRNALKTSQSFSPTP
jgi:hypothetical protein